MCQNCRAGTGQPVLYGAGTGWPVSGRYRKVTGVPSSLFVALTGSVSPCRTRTGQERAYLLGNNNNNNNEYLECLTHTGPKRLHVLYKYILSKFNAYNMTAHTHARTHTQRLAHIRTRARAHTHTHTHTHTSRISGQSGQ